MIHQMIEKRERLEALLFFGVNSVLIPLWWLSLVVWPSARSFYFGQQYSQHWRWDFALPDILTAGLGILYCLWLLRTGKHLVWMTWAYTGMTVYAWGSTLAIAIADSKAYFGFVIMTLVAAISLAFSVRLQKFNILWGPFSFKIAPRKDSKAFRRQSFGQVVVMWGVFLFLIPVLFAVVEYVFGWSWEWIHLPFQTAVAFLIFGIGAFVGLWSNRLMNDLGEGTPLPSACAKKLVISGPYRIIRNPMAFGGITMGVGVAVLIGSPLIFTYAIIGAFWWEILVRPLEEVFLAECFGEQYEKYVRGTHCWLPFGLR